MIHFQVGIEKIKGGNIHLYFEQVGKCVRNMPCFEGQVGICNQLKRIIMETNREREIRLAEFVHKQRQSLPHSIEDDELDKLSGVSVDEIRDMNEETENFWKRGDE